MKFKNYIFLAGTVLSAMFVSSCSSDDDPVPAPYEPKANTVSFVEEPGTAVLAVDADEFEVTVVRTQSDSEQIVAIEVLQAADCFTVPSCVTFAEGETEVTFKVGIDSTMKAFTNYDLRLRIPEVETDPYAMDAPSPMYNKTLLKEDYQPWAVGVFSENVLFGDQWEQVLEYSPMLDIYRFPDLIVAGTPYHFKWTPATAESAQVFYFCDADGKKIASQATGYVHSSYGMITSTFSYDENCGYLPTENGLGMFVYIAEYTVSAGSFGAGYEIFEITEKF